MVGTVLRSPWSLHCVRVARQAERQATEDLRAAAERRRTAAAQLRQRKQREAEQQALWEAEQLRVRDQRLGGGGGGGGGADRPTRHAKHRAEEIRCAAAAVEAH
jgi:hypothetical protein